MMPRPLIVLSACVIVAWAVWIRPPHEQPPSVVIIPEGVTVAEAGQLLKDHGVIVSADAFSFFATLWGGVRFGGYAFVRPADVLQVSWRVSHGDRASLARVTVPEGASSYEIRDIIRDALPGFDAEKFVAIAQKNEGYFFPDTYFFSAGMSPESVVATMRRTFDKRTAELRPSREVVIMASLLEKEARQFETRQIIAGILWKRLKQNMPLQVDAVFGYIFATSTFNPTFDQLKVLSPYNTYLHAGLPPGPIGNPGLEALQAAMNPTETPYWYYLTGRDGTMRYARTFDEHVANRKYLK